MIRTTSFSATGTVSNPRPLHQSLTVLSRINTFRPILDRRIRNLQDATTKHPKGVPRLALPPTLASNYHQVRDVALSVRQALMVPILHLQPREVGLADTHLASHVLRSRAVTHLHLCLRKWFAS